MKDQQKLYNSYLSLAGFPKARVLSIMQNDKTELSFELKDINGDTVDLNETTGQVQIIDSDRDVLVAVSDTTIEGGIATFSIDKILPADEYEVYIRVGEQYFPSTENSFILKVVSSYDTVEDFDVDNIQTIDIVIEAVQDKVIEAMSQSAETIINNLIKSDPERFKGEKGDPLRFEDLTQDQVDQITGDDATPLKPSELGSNELEMIRGHKGETGLSAYEEAVEQGFEGTEQEWVESLALTFEELTPEQIEELTLSFDDLTPEQIEELKLKISSSHHDSQGNAVVVFNDGTEITVNKGEKGDRGQSGEVAFEDLDEQQKASLFIPPKIYTRDEYNNLESYDPNTLYFIEEV